MQGRILFYDSDSTHDYLAFYLLDFRILPVVNSRYDPQIAQLLGWKGEIDISNRRVIFDSTLWKESARQVSQTLYPFRRDLKTHFFEAFLLPPGINVVATSGTYDFLLFSDFDLPGTFDINSMQFNLNGFSAEIHLWQRSSIRYLHSSGSCLTLDDDEGTDCGDLVFFRNNIYKKKLFLGCTFDFKCLFLDLESNSNLRDSILEVLSLKIPFPLTDEKICQGASIILTLQNTLTPNDWPFFLLEERNLFSTLSRDFKRIVDLAQGSQPSPIFNETPLFLSKRAKTQMTHLFEEIRFQPLPISGKAPILNSPLDNSKFTFALKIATGIYSDLYLPVMTYRPSLSQGYYTLGKVDPYRVKYTYYYWEPESPFLLFSHRSWIARNKLSAYLELKREIQNYSIQNSDRISQISSFIWLNFELSLEEWSRLQNQDEIFFPNSPYSSWLRPLREVKIPFENGALDFLDSEIGELGQTLNLTTIVYTHQPGSHGRLITEILDLRLRVDSFRSIKIDKTTLQE